MRKFKFVGFKQKTYYGEGKFTVGETYQSAVVREYTDVDLYPDALFTDDKGLQMWEELHGFEEVTENDTE